MLLTLLLTTMLVTAPPLEGFPSAVTPTTERIASNGRVIAFGDRVLTLDEIGVIARVDGVVVTPQTRVLGCCALEVDFADAALDGEAVLLTISHGGVDNDFLWGVGDVDENPPATAGASIVQIVTTTSFSPPLPALEGGGFLVTIDIEDVVDDVGISSLQAFDVDGTLIGVAPPDLAGADRIVVGVRAGGEQCLRIVAVDTAGLESELPVCGDIAVPVVIDEPDDRDDDDDDEDGCAASVPMPLFALLLLLVPRRVRVAFGAVVFVVINGACAERVPQGSAMCGDDFDDHSTAVDTFSEEFFEEHARAQFDFVALKVLILHPDSDAPVVGVLDSDFFPLHDTWFAWRLVNGERACGGEQIVPLDPALEVDQWSDVVDWAREQQRLPPFLDLVDDDGERLTAPDFYRLARNEEPRSYVPAYLRRDDDEDTWQWRVGGRTTLEPHHVEAIFTALDPHVPSTHELIWVSSPSPSQTVTAEAMKRDRHPLASRIRLP